MGNSDKKIRAAVYARVSTLLGQDVNNQLVPLREYCTSRGFELVPDREFVDNGVSGAQERRPALDRMVKDARQRKFDVLVVAGLDRLGRQVKALLVLLDELRTLGVKFISLREGFDDSPQGQLLLTIVAAISQMERELTRQRVRETFAAKKLLALQTGNGWRIGPPIKVTDEIIGRVLALRQEGLSIRAIEARLDRKISRGSIGRILQGYTGASPPCPTGLEKKRHYEDAQTAETIQRERHDKNQGGAGK